MDAFHAPGAHAPNLIHQIRGRLHTLFPEQSDASSVQGSQSGANSPCPRRNRYCHLTYEDDSVSDVSWDDDHQQPNPPQDDWDIRPDPFVTVSSVVSSYYRCCKVPRSQ
jgi:hypothetical protein